MECGRGQGSNEISPKDGMSEMDLLGDWRQEFRLEEAIEHGRKVRNSKPKKSIPIPGGSEIVQIDFVAPPCLKKRKPKGKRATSPEVAIVKEYTKRVPKQNCAAQCSVRIAELAVPSKRACVDNWEKNQHILPMFMIERLKNVVTNEAPVVKIADAYGSFKKRKRPKSKPTNTKEPNKSKPLKKECFSEKIYLCALFGHKIIKKLMRLLSVGQCNRLGSLYDIVAQEIDLIMQPIEINPYEREGYYKFRDEISKAVAVWIKLIMRDTCEKILEDQLRELEEEEGPVLDFLDALMANVMSKCAPGKLPKEFSAELMSDVEQLDNVSINTEEFCAQEINSVLRNMFVEDDVERSMHILENTVEHFELFDAEHQRASHDLDAEDDVDATEDANDVDNFEDAQYSEQRDNENVSSDGVDNENMSSQNQYVKRRDIGRSNSNISLSISGSKKAQFLSWASDTTLPKPISSAPNAELLREVNERWPESSASLVKTISIVKSVNSLGHIREAEEPQQSSSDNREYQNISDEKDKISDLVDNTFKQPDKQDKSKTDNEEKSVTDADEKQGVSSKNLQITIETEYNNRTQAHEKPAAPSANYIANNISIKVAGKSKEGNDGDRYNADTSDVGILSRFEFDKKDKSINTISKSHTNSAIQTQDSAKSLYQLSLIRDLTSDIKSSVTNLFGYLDKKLSVTDLCHGYLSQNGINTSRHTGHGDLNTEKGSEEITNQYFYETNDSVEPKINLKVDMKSAPFWLKWYEEDCKKGAITQKMGRQWCDDLLYTLEGLDEVNHWVKKTSESILRLKHRKELKRCCPSKCKQRLKDILELEKIYFTSAYYEKTNKHFNSLLLSHRSKYVRNKKPTKNWTCNCRKYLASLKK